MQDERIDFFIACLEMHLIGCSDPVVAMHRTVEDYAFVYIDIDPQTEPDWPRLLRGL